MKTLLLVDSLPLAASHEPVYSSTLRHSARRSQSRELKNINLTTSSKPDTSVHLSCVGTANILKVPVKAPALEGL